MNRRIWPFVRANSNSSATVSLRHRFRVKTSASSLSIIRKPPTRTPLSHGFQDKERLSLLLPMSGHHEVVTRLEDQVGVALPVKKRIWQQIVRAKIRAQAANLDPQSPAYRRLLALVQEVKSGDPTNREAQAAKIYWKNWLFQSPEADRPLDFRRDPDGAGVNALLNYGYAVVRAARA